MRFHGAALAAVLCVGLPVAALAGGAQDLGRGAMGRGGAFPFQGGQAIFKGVCQGCHMADAKGAVGAGRYPALASDARLEIATYAIAVILHGQKAMPPLGSMLSDRQVADVVDYVRTHFGNRYQGTVSAADVKAQR